MTHFSTIITILGWTAVVVLVTGAVDLHRRDATALTNKIFKRYCLAAAAVFILWALGHTLLFAVEHHLVVML